ncbi:MAG: hypothetical protein J3Q66DRAFT_127034 [Benniella sp.]|nr:MAG: hypothetical protein J3Q66DRAFT_127034 [Benniella sp.]
MNKKRWPFIVVECDTSTLPIHLCRPLGRLVVLSSCRPVVLSSCRPVVLSSCRPVVLSSCRPVVLSSCRLVHHLVLCHPLLSSTVLCCPLLSVLCHPRNIPHGSRCHSDRLVHNIMDMREMCIVSVPMMLVARDCKSEMSITSTQHPQVKRQRLCFPSTSSTTHTLMVNQE